jgi:hypothetical protein
MSIRFLATTAHMHLPNRTIALGVLLAFNAVAVHAQPKAAEAKPPVTAATAPQAMPLDLSLRPETGVPLPQPVPLGPALGPAAGASQANAFGLTAQPPATALPSGPVDVLQSASDEVKRVARWVADSRDNAGLPYVLIDKVNARVFVFNRAGQLRGATPALLGLARGDRLLAPNSATMADMPPEVRVTPAGRFVSRLAIDSHGKELLVLDYDASISLHAVVKGTPEERRAERLNSATSEDNRISFGCINVPTAFYETIVSPTFTRTRGIAYVLPETSPAATLFGFGLPAAGAAVAGASSGSTALDAQASPAASSAK